MGRLVWVDPTHNGGMTMARISESHPLYWEHVTAAEMLYAGKHISAARHVTKHGLRHVHIHWLLLNADISPHAVSSMMDELSGAQFQVNTPAV